MQHLKKTRPGLGWIKRSGASDEDLKDELLRVRREAESLAAQLTEAKARNAPDDTKDLAQGSETTSIVIDGTAFDIAWEQVIRSVLPQTFGAGAENRDIASALADLAREQHSAFREDPTLSRSSFGKVINQMVALGLIEGRANPPSPSVTMWVATPYGVKIGSRLVALRRREAW